jgi:hypothetical protein
MPKKLSVPIKTIGADEWAQLTVFAKDHIFCAEECRVKEQNYTFAGQHRVRLISLKKNVHWKIPVGTPLDVTEVPPAGAPPRRQPNR